MRFFIVACLFGLLIGSVGCMTHNWSSPLSLFQSGERSLTAVDEEAASERMPHSAKGELSSLRSSKRSGIESRAREIEGRLGL